MPRQRSKKLSETRKTDSEKKSSSDRKFVSEFDIEESESEELEDEGKDEDEEELDRLVLGDGADFMAELGRGVENQDYSGSEADLEAELRLDGGDEGLEDIDDTDLFMIDGGATAPDSAALIQRPSSEDGDSDTNAPAWEDSDDDRLLVSLAGNTRLRKLRISEAEDVVSGREYTRRLRRHFQSLNPVPEWASERPSKRRRRSSASSDASDEDSDGMEVDEEDLSSLPLAKILQNASSLTRITTTKKTKLRPEVIDIQRTRDIPQTQPSAIASLSFHPQYPVLLSSGLASTLYMHQIAPTALPVPNPLLTSIHIKSTPIHTSSFLEPNGDKVVFAGRRKYFHIWDLPSGQIQKITRIIGHKDDQKSMERFKLSPCGRYMALVGSSRKGGGLINILDTTTTQWIAAARIEGKNGVADFAWWSDGEGMTIAGKSGEIGEWSMESRSFVGLWNDEGAAGTTVITLGGRSGTNHLGGDRWVVVGSQSGVVNIYDRRTWVKAEGINVPARPEPTRRFMQLTTPTSMLQISPDGQLLVFASRWKRDALRLAHLPSCTVYRNWPTDKTPFGRVSAVAFGKGEGEQNVLAVGNEQGMIRLWEIRA